MSIKVNGKKIAGYGIPGKSAYEAAVDGGYTGTEEEFQTMLAGEAWAPATHASQHASDGSDPVTSADIGAVSKSGDTMTGNLGICKDAYPALLLKDLTNGSICKVENNDHSTTIQTLNVDGDENNKRFVAINDRTKVSDLTYGLTFNELVDGAYSSYKIYGEHNKPTPADIGAVSKTGDTMTGSLTVKTGAVPSVLLKSDGAGYTNIFKNNSSTVEDGTIIQDVDADGNHVSFKIQRYKGVANCLGLELDGNGTLYNILHTGNLSNLGVAKIETGSYVGIGKSGESYKNTLTFGFAPKTVLIWENGNVISALYCFSSASTSYAIIRNSNSGSPLDCSFNGNTMSWWTGTDTYSSDNQANEEGTTYIYVAFG